MGMLACFGMDMFCSNLLRMVILSWTKDVCLGVR